MLEVLDYVLMLRQIPTDATTATVTVKKYMKEGFGRYFAYFVKCEGKTRDGRDYEVERDITDSWLTICFTLFYLCSDDEQRANRTAQRLKTNLSLCGVEVS